MVIKKIKKVVGDIIDRVKVAIRTTVVRYRKKLIAIAIFILASIIGSGIFYSVTSPYFNTPIETIVIKSNEQLTKHYKKTAEEYQNLREVVDNLKARDEAIYKQLFEADVNNIRPYQTIENLGQKREDREKELSVLTLSELAETLIKNVNSLGDLVIKGTDEIVDTRSDVKSRKSLDLRAIPSIQPINNSDLTKTVVPAGMCINPFHKAFFLHKGIDYSISEDTRVYATADGKIETQSGGSAGGTITINHGAGYATVYGNLSKITVRNGQRVKRGDIIGRSGNTGTSFLPHLHYEVLYKNRNLDPLYFLFAELTPHQMKRIKEEAAQNIQSFD